MRNGYYKYSNYLQQKYGEKVYKLVVSLPVTCPNRDGVVGRGGCIFCGEEGTNMSQSYDAAVDIKEQVAINKAGINKRFNANKFIAYFQNYSNTYLPLDKFKEAMTAACEEDVVELAISTRPDCIRSDYLDFLAELSREKGVNISIEMGLQTVNYRTLKLINRGHSLAEFVDAVLACRERDFDTCAHLILNLPGDEDIDVVENAKLISALKVNQVKLHSLFIVKDTPLAKLYSEGQITIISKEEYVQRVVTFLEHLHPDIAIQRLVGRAPEENTLFCNWQTSGWKVMELIDQELMQQDTWQGKKCDYLNGRALRDL
ncbi:MAG: TIGR01212 family radical SAM protein [Bacillota bacterium]|nr:TIGR01212 family radical SAM protein [Bacillota bacterium]